MVRLVERYLLEFVFGKFYDLILKSLRVFIMEIF